MDRHPVAQKFFARLVTQYGQDLPDLGSALRDHELEHGARRRRPDGNLWFTEQDANRIGRITTAGVITEFPIPTADSAPVGIASGPDGNLWFTESDGNKIGRITTAGVITEFSLPTGGSWPTGIATGPDGNLWFTELVANKIGRITPTGSCGTGRGHVQPLPPISGLPCVSNRS